MSTNLPTIRQTTGLAVHAGPTVLGEKQVKIPTAGKIRPGIMRLTNAAAENPDAVLAYERGVAAGKTWDAIGLDVKRAMRLGDGAKSPLTPQNVPYFTVRRADFSMPEIADRIMDLYAEDRGEGRHLYRFPIVLPVDNWQAVLPHALKSYRSSELVYWSEYGPDGRRYCKTKQPLRKDERAQRFSRPFGGRATMLRPDNNGLCDPEKCPEYQATPQQCRLSGSFIFYIPHVPGAGALELPMTSFYGLQGIRQQLELMAYLRGRISGTYQGQPMFYLTKRQEDVSMLDLNTGKPKRVKQWITIIEGAVDMTAMLTAPEEDDPPSPESAAAVLEGPRAIEGEVLPADDEEPEFEAPTDIENDAPGEGNDTDGAPTVEELQKEIRARTRELGLSWLIFEPYATGKWRDGWKTDVRRLARVLDELSAVTDADTYRATFDDIPF